MSAVRESYTLFERHDRDAVAVWSRGRAISVAELLAGVHAIASRLGPAKPHADRAPEINIDVTDRLAFVVALLAAWSRGYAVHFGEPATGARLGRTHAMWLHGGSRSGGLDVVSVLATSCTQQACDHPTIVVPAERRLVALWTSGSTGEPQLHDKSARQLIGEAETLRDAFDVMPTDRVLGTAAPAHIYGLLFGVVLPMVSGASFVDAAPLQPTAVAAALRDGCVNTLVSVPAHLRALVTLDAGALGGLRRVFSSGAPLLASTAAAMQQAHGLAVTEVLGSTETGGIAWREQFAADSRWQSLPGVDVEQDQDERLVVRSSFLPANTSRWITGDHITMAADGRFEHHGRVDGVVKIAGKRVALAELERALFEVSGVADATVAAREVGGARGTEIAALVVGDGIDGAAVREALLRRFDRVVVPRRVMVVKRVPRGENGKVTKAAVFELWDR